MPKKTTQEKIEMAEKLEKVLEKDAKVLEEALKPTVAEPESSLAKLLAKVEELERKDIENQKQLKMLYSVADKGRVFNYENSTKEKKPFQIRLSVFDGKIIIGWRNAKDILVKHPQTGATVGEEQQMEVILLDKEGNKTTHTFNGYSAFSNAKYDNRIDCEVVSKAEDYEGRLTYNVVLPDGRNINLGAQFVN